MARAGIWDKKGAIEAYERAGCWTQAYNLRKKVVDKAKNNNLGKDVFELDRFTWQIFKSDNEFIFTDKEINILKQIPNQEYYGLVDDPHTLEQKLLAIYKKECNVYMKRKEIGEVKQIPNKLKEIIQGVVRWQ